MRELADGLIEACNSRDPERMRSLLAADWVTIDHRLASFGTVDAETFIALNATDIPGIAARNLTVTEFEMAGHAMIVRMLETGAVNDGGEFITEMIAVSLIQEGRYLRTEVFPPDAESDARMVFEQFVRTASPRT
jgi:hypothetical protein